MTKDDVTPQQVLDCPIQDDAFDESATVRTYLVALLETLWREKELFSAKRPFGYSSWECTIYAALVRAGFVDGALDSDGCLDEVDEDTADELVDSAIRSLLTPVS